MSNQNNTSLPANEPVEPTGDIKTWIEQEALKECPQLTLDQYEQMCKMADIRESLFDINQSRLFDKIKFTAGANALYAHLQPRIAELESRWENTIELLRVANKERAGFRLRAEKLESLLETEINSLAKDYFIQYGCAETMAVEHAEAYVKRLREKHNLVQGDEVSDTTAAESTANADQQTSSKEPESPATHGTPLSTN